MLRTLFNNLPFWDKGQRNGDGPFLIDFERDMTEIEYGQFCAFEESLGLGVGLSRDEFRMYLALRIMECKRQLDQKAMIDGDDPDTARLLNDGILLRNAYYGDDGAKADFCLSELDRVRVQRQGTLSPYEYSILGGCEEAYTEMFNRYSEEVV